MDLDPVVRYFWEREVDDTWREPERRIYDCELVYNSAGSYVLRLQETERLIRPGSLIILPPALQHAGWACSGASLTRHCVHFDWTPDHSHIAAPLMCLTGEPFTPDRVHPVPKAFAPLLPLISEVGNHKNLLPVLKLMLQALRDSDPVGEVLLAAVLHHFLRQHAPVRVQRPTGKAERAVLAVKHLIDTSYTEPLDYRDFQRAGRLSRSRLCEVFARHIGTPPTRYLNQVRLAHACRLLAAAELGVAEIARRVGFGDANYFARLFRKQHGMSPTQYQRAAAADG